MIKKALLFLFSLVLGLVLFFWVGKAVGWHNIKNSLIIFTGWHGLAIFILTLLMALIGNWKWKEIIRGMSANISFWQLFKVYLAGYSVRYLAPVVIIGAEIFQGKTLKDKNNIPWPKSMASIIIDRIMEWTINLLVIFLGTIFFLLAIGLPPLQTGIICGAFLLILAVLLTFFYFKNFKNESIAKEVVYLLGKRSLQQPLEIEQEMFAFFDFKNKRMWTSFGICLLRALVVFLRTWLLIFFLGKSVGPLTALSIVGFYHLAMILPIPAALGIHEAIQTFAFKFLKMGLGAATVFAMIIRAAELILSLLGLVFLFRFGVEIITFNFLKKLELVVKKK